jgi:hypothetical protein
MSVPLAYYRLYWDGLNFVEKRKKAMIEKQTINGKEVWLKVDPYHVERSNPNIIPTEYFTATYFFEEPSQEATNGEQVKDEDGEPKLFESPVAALTFAWKKLKSQ